MKEIKYQARKGAPFKEKEAQAIGERLYQLAKQKKGRVKPYDVVDDAKDKNSPYHHLFEWDDKKASYEYRLHQARNIINHIVEVVVIQGVKTEQKSFFSVDISSQKQAYVTLETALTTPNYRKQVLNQTITALENATNLMKLFRSYEENK